MIDLDYIQGYISETFCDILLNYWTIWGTWHLKCYLCHSNQHWDTVAFLRSSVLWMCGWMFLWGERSIWPLMKAWYAAEQFSTQGWIAPVMGKIFRDELLEQQCNQCRGSISQSRYSLHLMSSFSAIGRLMTVSPYFFHFFIVNIVNLFLLLLILLFFASLFYCLWTLSCPLLTEGAIKI